MPVKEGEKIKVEYTGTFDDGTVFDASEKHGQPLEFIAGGKQVVKGFDEAVIGMEEGEEKEIKLKPEDAYGDPNPELVKEFPKDKIPIEQELEVGMMLAMQLPDGNQIPARVAEVGETDVKIDLNHPLAGKNLNFKIKIVENMGPAEACAPEGCSSCSSCGPADKPAKEEAPAEEPKEEAAEEKKEE